MLKQIVTDLVPTAIAIAFAFAVAVLLLMCSNREVDRAECPAGTTKAKGVAQGRPFYVCVPTPKPETP